MKICVIDGFILADELPAKALHRPETLSVSNNVCGILVSSLELPVIFHEHFKVAPEEFFVADYQVVYLVTLHLHFYIESLYTDIIPNQNKFSSVSLQYSYKSL